MRFAGIAMLACSMFAGDTPVSYHDMTSIGRDPVLVNVAPSRAIAVRGRVNFRDTPEPQRRDAVYQALGKAFQHAGQFQIKVTGPPIIVNRRIGRDGWGFEVMLPVEAGASLPQKVEGISIEPAPGGLAVAMDHIGPMSKLNESYLRLKESAPKDARLLDLTWEQYIDDPAKTPPAQQRIRVFRAVESPR